MLHLYSANRGRIGAIAKGSRRPRSRFGGRLEPFFRLDLVLHEGRGDLCTVTSASTVEGHAGLRANGPALSAAARGCDAVLRLLDEAQPNPGAYNLLCRYLGLLDSGAGDGASAALAFRLKLALAAGFAPELASCARCGEARRPRRLLGGRGRSRLRRLRARRLRDRRGVAAVHGRGARAPARRGATALDAGAAPGRAGDRRDTRTPRARAVTRGRLGGLLAEHALGDAEAERSRPEVREAHEPAEGEGRG